MSADTTIVGVDVVSWGVASSIRDGGRTGLAHLGKGRGGAADLGALHLANRLIGNHPDTAAIETSGGLRLRLEQNVVVSVTGSPADLIVEDGPPLGWGAPTALPRGAAVHIGRLRGGARCYLAVRGGLRQLDPASLAIGLDPATPLSAVAASPEPLDGPVHIWPGPRLDWFEEASVEQLVVAEWVARPESDRVGLRVAGPHLRRRTDAELPSEGLVEGAIQVPPDGQPIVMLADHPTTGGYPVIAVVDPDHLGRVAQRPAGAPVRFRWAAGRVPGRGEQSRRDADSSEG